MQPDDAPRKVALVIGAGDATGGAIAARFAKEGHVACLTRRSADRLGPLVDRMSRRRLMIGSDLVRFGVFAALPFVESPAAIVALAAVAGVATGFFIEPETSMTQSIRPDWVATDQVVVAVEMAPGSRSAAPP